MKRSFILFTGLLLAPLFFLVSCNKGKTSTGAETHLCPMHPQVVQEGPGSCPICGMDLVPAGKSSGNKELMLSESQIQLANIQTLKISSGNFTTGKVLSARLVPDPGLRHQVSSRFAGRIEQLYVKETGFQVKKGQPLFSIYSEELLSLQQDYILQLKQAAAFPGEKIYKTLALAAADKLRLYGYSNAQIGQLAKDPKASPLITVYAPASGVVTELSSSEGQYLAEGSPIMSIDDLSSLWVEAELYPGETAGIKPGSELNVSVNGFPELEQTVRATFVAPQMNSSSQITLLRAPLKSHGQLQAGMQATVSVLTSKTGNAVSLPLDAVIRDERGARVWVKTGAHTFAPRKVSTGQEDEQHILITSGLEGVKEVVSSGAYLLHSEYELKYPAAPAGRLP